MELSGISIIVVCCYIVGEIYKIVFKSKEIAYRFIPIFTTVVGGLLGILIYFTNPELLLDVSNPWTALVYGFVCGASSTGTNQIIKQILKKENEKNGKQ